MSENTQLKQRVSDLEHQLALQKELAASLQRQLETASTGDFDARVREAVEQRTRDLRSSLERAEKEKKKRSELLINISHEILTPMDGILGMTGLVLETELTEEQRRYLDMVSASADRLLGVFNDILDYSQIEAGKLQLSAVDFDLFDLLECDLYILKLAAQHKKLDLLHYIDPDIPQNVHGDPERLRQVLVNLVNNAIKFTDQGLVTVDVTLAGNRGKNLVLKFSITDTGRGVSFEKQPGIFTALGSAGSEWEHKHSGAGLGLAVSAKLVALAGGEIGLESEPGEGATFWFTWPVAESQAGAHDTLGRVLDETQENSFILKGASVLLAEDEPISGEITEKLLQQAGMAVTMVENGEQAVEKIEKGGRYQVVLMDVQMPVMDGLAATQHIRAWERGRGGHQTIIALTAHAMQGDRERCLQAGMDDYLTKPINKDQLLDMLTKYLTRTALVVVGDQKSQQEIVQVLIESGWRVTIVETGRSAVYEASLSNFDLIVVDTFSLQKDGVDTAGKIRNLEEFSGRRATIIGIGSPDERGIKSGIDDYLSIPMDKELLKRRLAVLQER